MSQSENWLPVLGYEGIYSVSDLGRVMSHERVVLTKANKHLPVHERILKAGKTKEGFKSVTLYTENEGQPVSVGRLVLSSFSCIPLTTDSVVGYRDHNKNNCALSNLYWQSASAANLYKHEKGNMPLGKNGTHPKAKLNLQQVQALKGRKLGYGEQKFLSTLLGVSHICISKIVRNETWKGA